MVDVNKELLLDGGIEEKNIEISEESTYNNLELHSARREGKNYGLNSMLVMMK